MKSIPTQSIFLDNERLYIIIATNFSQKILFSNYFCTLLSFKKPEIYQCKSFVNILRFMQIDITVNDVLILDYVLNLFPVAYNYSTNYV